VKVRDLMTKDPVTVYEDSTVLWACQQMEARRQSAVLVVPRPQSPAEQTLPPRQPTGIVSEHDLVKATLRYPEGFAQRKVSEVMNTTVVCIDPEEDLQAAANLMILLRVRRLPVVSKGRLAGLVSRGKLMESLRGELAQAQRQAAVAEDKAGHDALTGLANRLLFDDALTRAFHTARDHGTPLSLLMADLDHFKRVNDTHGHPAGDLVLRQLAGILKGAARKSDLVARWGGEEFTVLLPITAQPVAQAQAEAMRAAVEAFTFGEAPLVLKLTVSVGVGLLTPGMGDEGDLLKAADEALYSAKQAGRNQVAVAGA
jgi:diguanylate cyclase (GGDEF)-like protein